MWEIPLHHEGCSRLLGGNTIRPNTTRVLEGNTTTRHFIGIWKLKKVSFKYKYSSSRWRAVRWSSFTLRSRRPPPIHPPPAMINRRVWCCDVWVMITSIGIPQRLPTSQNNRPLPPPRGISPPITSSPHIGSTRLEVTLTRICSTSTHLLAPVTGR